MPNWTLTESHGLVWLEPDWPAPAKVHALSTTRLGGVSEGPYQALNLAHHVQDHHGRVEQNRARLKAAAGLPAQPLWLEQVHGCDVALVGNPGCSTVADASWSDQPGQVCVVMTADCLPLLLCDPAGHEVAAVHAGWRGLCDGVIEATLARFSRPTTELLAWLGPAIGPDAFEVGSEVRQAFIDQDSVAEAAFRSLSAGKYLADLFTLARQRLQKAGLLQVYGGGVCTYSDAQHFFSYRRDGVTGRMATLIWLGDDNG